MGFARKAVPTLEGTRMSVELGRRVAARRAGLSTEGRALLRARLAGASSDSASDSIPRRSESGPAPLAFAQRRLWFLDQLVPGHSFYNIPAALPLRFRVDVDAIDRALSEIVRRHAALRTTFTAGSEGPVQIVHVASAQTLQRLDLSRLSPSARNVELRRLATDSARTPFNLVTGPLMRTTLVTLEAEYHVLLLTMHHIVSDGWSLGVLFRELIELYEAFSLGRPSPLAELPIQYVDFAVWQRQQLSGEQLQRLIDYWRRKLAGMPELALITDYARPAVASFAGAVLAVRFEMDLIRKVSALAAAHKCTLFQTSLATFMAVLSRFSGQFDVVVGAPIANRTRPEVEPLIGFFVNSLVLRTDLSGDPSFVEILARVRSGTIEAYAHQDLPFERLVEELQPDRDLSRNPLCQVTFQIQNTPGATAGKSAPIDQAVEVERATAIFDLAFSLWETTEGLVGGIEYSTDLFEAATIQCIVDGMRLALEAVVADPSITLSRLPILSEHQRKRHLASLRGPVLPLPAPTLHDLFDRRAEEFRERTAVLDRNGSISFVALQVTARGVASVLRQEGVARASIVGLLLPRSRHFVPIMLGTLKAGGAYLPLDPELPRARLAEIVARAGCAVIVADGVDVVLPGRTIQLRDLLDRAARAKPADPGDTARPEDPCYVLFTSGSTGRPKGVAVPHRAIVNHMAWMLDALPLAPHDRVLQRTATHFDASVWEFWAPLLAGATLAIPPPFEPADTDQLARVVTEMGITVLQTVPSLLKVLLDEPHFADVRLRRLCCGGEMLPPQLLSRAREKLPGVELVNLYGPTETTVQTTYWTCAPHERVPDRIPVGRAITNANIYVVDAANELVPPNVIGEIVVGGLPVALGYLGETGFTAERFVPDPVHPEGISFRTGDSGWYQADGVLFCTGRTDDQVKVRGNRVELGEIELALSEHALVAEAATVPFVDQRGETAIAAFVTLATEDKANGERSGYGRLWNEYVGNWEQLYEAVYTGSAAAADPTFNTTGWISSYTGAPIPLPQMRQWLRRTVERILALNPNRVIEVGCGVGLILFGVAPQCETYAACEISQAALASLRDALDYTGLQCRDVRLLHLPAHRVSEMPRRDYDTAILNSVVQYFPSADYLADVVRELVSLLARSGRIFIGDVRSLALLRAFHTSVEAYRSGDDITAGALADRVAAAIEREKELLIDAVFFRNLTSRVAELGGAAVRLKRGSELNEMTRYRYDVVLEVGAAAAPARLEWIDWRRSEFDLDRLAQILAGDSFPVAICAIPNSRVRNDVALAQALDAVDPDSTVESIRRRLQSAEGVDPELAALLAERHGYVAEILPNRDLPDHFDLVVHSGDLAPASIDAAQRQETVLRGASMASNPLVASVGAALLPALKAHLAERLPGYMMPALIEPISRIPRLPNGKIDRATLKVPEIHDRPHDAVLLVPHGPLEQVIAGTFAGVLRVARVGRTDNFFSDLGGHSLLATQVAARLRDTLQIDIPLRLLFEHQTTAELARALLANPDSADAITIAATFAMQVSQLDAEELDEELARTLSKGTSP
jgi:amino acid adenylation domain-containing protein